PLQAPSHPAELLGGAEIMCGENVGGKNLASLGMGGNCSEGANDARVEALRGGLSEDAAHLGCHWVCEPGRRLPSLVKRRRPLGATSWLQQVLQVFRPADLELGGLPAGALPPRANGQTACVQQPLDP